MAAQRPTGQQGQEPLRRPWNKRWPAGGGAEVGGRQAQENKGVHGVGEPHLPQTADSPTPGLGLAPLLRLRSRRGLAHPGPPEH